MTFGSKFGHHIAWDLKEPSKARKIFSRTYYWLFGFPTHLGTRINARSITKFIGNDKTILDIGCGNGIYSLEFSEKNFVVGVDLSIDEIKTAKHISEKTRENAFFVVADATHLPFKKSVFDLAICLEVLEHIVDDECALEEAARVIKRNGKLIISVPHKEQKRYLLKKDFYELEEQHVREGYDVASMNQLLDRFDVITIEKTFLTFSSIAWELATLSRNHWIFFPLLNFISLMDVFSKSRGNGITVVSRRK
jgi:SAM-dependent methyltransferase